jgi:hypothetical protein
MSKETRAEYMREYKERNREYLRNYKKNWNRKVRKLLAKPTIKFGTPESHIMKKEFSPRRKRCTGCEQLLEIGEIHNTGFCARIKQM